ncbi:hypothetical protein T492DRAFT_130510 [Pavlovales sp. CCMP2436]|nr:hypothetical protein T492DRAFT_130510 [Pavlovales sp. CCMP2436]
MEIVLCFMLRNLLNVILCSLLHVLYLCFLGYFIYCFMILLLFMLGHVIHVLLFICLFVAEQVRPSDPPPPPPPPPPLPTTTHTPTHPPPPLPPKIHIKNPAISMTYSLIHPFYFIFFAHTKKGTRIRAQGLRAAQFGVGILLAAPRCDGAIPLRRTAPRDDARCSGRIRANSK